MNKRLAIIPERCSGCRTCELVCSLKHFSVNNPKKSAIRVMMAYPHPVVRMPIVCSHCRKPVCANVCPTDAIFRDERGRILINEEECISCFHCADACPFGAIYIHEDMDYPIKCDLCNGEPACVKECPKNAIMLIPTHILGQVKRINNILSYSQMKEIEYFEKGDKKVIRYAEIGKEQL